MADPIRVLYVDDESGLLEVAKLFLETGGAFTVDTLTSASEALRHLKTERYDAIISDYQMPDTDGISFLKQLKASGNTTPFIIFTGRGREEIAIEAYENGADFYIQKGGEPRSQFAELSNKIQKAVDHRRADMQVVALNKLYSVLSATNKAIVRIHNKKELLDEICRIVIDIGDFTMAWAGRVNTKTHIIEPIASYGHIDEGLETIAISTYDIPHGQGPTGTAFRERKFNVCNDIAGDPKTAPWREWALKLGYRSFAAFPFALDTRNAGVITYYASEPGFFTDQIIRLLDEQTSDISFAFITLDHEEQRAAAEKDLKKSELQYRRLFETARDAILILDGDTGEIIEANTFILDLLGYPLEYCIGRHLWELGFIKDKTIAQKAFTELKTNGYIRYENIPLETKDGRSIIVEFISHAYLVGDKKIFQCNIRDVTSRKVFEDALKVSELRYRRLFETARDAILILDGDTGEIIDANLFILDLLGYPLEYCIGKHLWELGFIKDKSIAQQAFTELKTNDFIHYEDIPLETKDGRSITVDFISNAYLAGDKKIFQCSIRDITKRKRMEDTLRKSEEFLNKIINSISDPVHVKNRQHEVILVNDAACRLFNLSREEIIGKTAYDLFPGKEMADISRQKDEEVFRTGEESVNEEINTYATGKSVTVLVKKTLYTDTEGNQFLVGITTDITRRKQTEEALLELVDYNRSLIEASIDPLVTIDCDGKIQDVNTATERATGMPRNELIGTDFSDYFTEPEKAREGYRLVFSRGNVLDFPLELRHRDGRTIPVCYNATVYHDRDGNLKGVVAAARDITGLRRTEEALRESEMRYRALVDNALEAILIFDFSGTALFANNATAALVEVDDPHTLTGRNVLEFIAPESRDAVLADFTSVMAGRDAYLTQYKVITVNGREIWVESIGKKIEFGGAPADIVMLRDITERKRAEETLKESECRMKDIISFLPDATLVIDKNGTVLAWNRAMEIMTGVPAEQMIGKGNYEYALPFYHERRPITVDLVLHDDPAIVTKYPVMKKEGSSLYSEIFIPYLNKGEGAHLWFIASPLYDAAGNLTGAIESIRDITERKRADDSLRQASRKLNLLSSITRHDINNQLTILMGYTTLLEKKQPDPSFRDYFQKINASAGRISAMIQFTKEYEQIGVTAPTWQDCRTLVEKAAKDAPLGNVIVKNDLPSGAELFADPLIIKVFYNLMDNAVRHGGKITTIGFTIVERDSDHILVCEDNGNGVPAEEKEMIFERGFGKNTGLGLYLAREILSITGITITENGEPGKGARFELVVPKGIYRMK